MTQESVNFDKILERIGPFGPYQIYNLILIGLAGIPVGAYNMANAFLAGLPKYVCNRNYNSTFTTKKNDSDYYRYSIKANGDNGYSDYPFSGDSDPCDYYSYIGRTSGLKNNTHEVEQSCPDWKYDRTIYDRTIVTEWDLVCSSEWKIALAQSTYMLGFLLGAVCFGSVSDTIGRKKAWFISLLLMVVSGTLAAFMPDYWTFIITRTVSGIAAAGAFTCGFVITMEVIGTDYRMKPGVFYQGWFASGYMLLSLVAYFIRDFRYLQLLLGLVPIVFIPYYWLIGESPRWLIAEGRMESASIEVKKASRMNKTEYPDDLMGQETKALMKTETDSNISSESRSGSVLDLLRTPNMRRKSLNTFFNWFVNSMVYYGLSMGTGDLIGGPYVNLFLSGLMEFPGYLIAVLTLDRVGRRLPLAFMLCIGGVCCLSMAVIPSEYAVATTTLSMIGKLGISGSFAVIYVYSAELCPTVVRNVGVGAGSMCARVGGLIAPFVAMLSKYWRPLPLLIFGGSSLAAAALSLLLPETLDQSLPETLEDGEQFGKDAYKKIFQFSISRKNKKDVTEKPVDINV